MPSIAVTISPCSLVQLNTFSLRYDETAFHHRLPVMKIITALNDYGDDNYSSDEINKMFIVSVLFDQIERSCTGQ